MIREVIRHIKIALANLVYRWSSERYNHEAMIGKLRLENKVMFKSQKELIKRFQKEQLKSHKLQNELSAVEHYRANARDHLRMLKFIRWLMEEPDTRGRMIPEFFTMLNYLERSRHEVRYAILGADAVVPVGAYSLPFDVDTETVSFVARRMYLRGELGRVVFFVPAEGPWDLIEPQVKGVA